MKRVNFVIGFHCHQPVGNFDWVFEDAYKRAYEPLIATIEKYSSLKFVLHYSGCLLDWLLEHKPEFLQRLKKLVKEGRCELMSGGYYEPIFPLIPDADKIGQVLHMNKFIKDYFEYEPAGAWLTERVWEPSLAKTFNKAGTRYVVVDDTHFEGAGLKEDEMHGYFVTEDEGLALSVFPINARMRYNIPFRAPEETEAYLASVATEEGDRLVALADDGEKFGIWPDTHEWVYGKKWLEKFFTMLEKNKEWIKTTTFAEYLKTHKPLGRVYMPTSSYKEMLEWSMPAESILEYEVFTEKLKHNGDLERFGRFVKGGLFRNFLSKYPESNSMQKKMVYVSEKIHKLDLKKAEAKEALRLLWSGQCNCAYWHGVFGGLYLNHLRFAVYRRLIQAEMLCDKIRFGGKPWLECEVADFDKDNREEVLLNSNLYNLYLDPSEGGHIFEFDIKKAGFNALDTLTRRKEAYHKDLFKEDGTGGGATGHDSIHELKREFSKTLKAELVYDKYRKVSLIEHFCPAEQSLADFSRPEFKEIGDFVNAEYAFTAEKKGKTAFVIMEMEGKVWGNSFKVKKTVEFSENDPEIKIEYEICNTSKYTTTARFGVEFNFGMLGGDSPDRNYYFDGKKPADPRMSGRSAEKNVKTAAIVDSWLNVNIALSFSEAAEVWRMPVETISQSIGKLEKVYQSSCVFPSWLLTLEPGMTKKLSIKKKVTDAL
ncbi:MAG: alpha-amylase/4-alpha-glucanotransferase domain-containing protein [Candidatus Firestonebacteria bacterium]